MADLPTFWPFCAEGKQRKTSHPISANLPGNGCHLFHFGFARLRMSRRKPNKGFFRKGDVRCPCILSARSVVMFS